MCDVNSLQGRERIATASMKLAYALAPNPIKQACHSRPSMSRQRKEGTRSPRRNPLASHLPATRAQLHQAALSFPPWGHPVLEEESPGCHRSEKGIPPLSE